MTRHDTSSRKPKPKKGTTKRSPEATSVSPTNDKTKKPKRPLSAYNFYFREERLRWLDETNATPEGRAMTPKERFSAMGRVISRRWLRLSDEDRKPYQQRALEAYDVYLTDMDAYRARQQQDQEYASPPTGPPLEQVNYASTHIQPHAKVTVPSAAAIALPPPPQQQEQQQLQQQQQHHQQQQQHHHHQHQQQYQQVAAPATSSPWTNPPALTVQQARRLAQGWVAPSQVPPSQVTPSQGLMWSGDTALSSSNTATLNVALPPPFLPAQQQSAPTPVPTTITGQHAPHPHGHPSSASFPTILEQQEALLRAQLAALTGLNLPR